MIPIHSFKCDKHKCLTGSTASLWPVSSQLHVSGFVTHLVSIANNILIQLPSIFVCHPVISNVAPNMFFTAKSIS